MRPRGHKAVPRPWPALILASAMLGSCPPPAIGQVETAKATIASGEVLDGRLTTGDGPEFAFQPEGDGLAVPLVAIRSIGFEHPASPVSLGRPPFRLELGGGTRLSGRLRGISESELAFEPSGSPTPLTIPRARAIRLERRPGEVEVLHDGFETLDEATWGGQVGAPESTDADRVEGSRSLRLPSAGSAVTFRVPAPFRSGRLDLAFFDSGEVVPGHRGFVDLTFRGPDDKAVPVRVALGWDEETTSVETPDGPAMEVQRLPRERGWHRLAMQFGPDAFAVDVDGAELTHGAGLGLPLVEVRLGTSSSGGRPSPERPALLVDDLSLTRRVEPVGSPETEPELDEILTTQGDQLFGEIGPSDGQALEFRAGGQAWKLDLSDAYALRFRRRPVAFGPSTGLQVKAEWASGADPRLDLDAIEGRLVSVGTDAIAVEAPGLPAVAIPTARLARLVVIGPRWQLPVDLAHRHLGDDFEPTLDPPSPHPGPLRLAFDLTEAPTRPALIVVEVVQMIGQEGSHPFAAEVRRGELATLVTLNDQPLGPLNRALRGANERPERVSIPIPPEALKAGPNLLEFRQVGTPDNPSELDDLGLLGVWIESPAGARRPPTTP